MKKGLHNETHLTYLREIDRRTFYEVELAAYDLLCKVGRSFPEDADRLARALGYSDWPTWKEISEQL